jgi:regulator of PEP synthase PpsR (kinase-PPPase family)
MSPRRAPQIFVVSDGRGETCERLVKAALVQFEGQRHRIVRKAEVRTVAQVRRVVESAAEAGAVVFYTLAAEKTRQAMRKACRERLVPKLDLLGPAISALHDLFQADPGETPGLLYQVEREQLDRYAAIDYTLRHDDGQRPHELSKADVVLVGVSRASKSATCFYLAYEGVRAANVPLVPDIEPPAQLLRLPENRVIGLRVNVSRLLNIREHRVASMNLGPLEDYLDKRSVAREVNHANRLMEERGWRGIDVSYMAIEEIAKEVLKLLGRRRRTLP